jgi:hypothetical protein
MCIAAHSERLQNYSDDRELEGDFCDLLLMLMVIAGNSDGVTVDHDKQE